MSAGWWPSEVYWTLSCDNPPGSTVSGVNPSGTGNFVSDAVEGANCDLTMGDTWGDGWNSAYFNIAGMSFTLWWGASGAQSFTIPLSPPPPMPPNMPPIVPLGAGGFVMEVPAMYIIYNFDTVDPSDWNDRAGNLASAGTAELCSCDVTPFCTATAGDEYANGAGGTSIRVTVVWIEAYQVAACPPVASLLAS